MPDRQFEPAKARIVNKNTVEVWSPKVQQPVAVRYAWADNPVCNLQNRAGLPATPFRTDDWPVIKEVASEKGAPRAAPGQPPKGTGGTETPGS